MGYYTTNGCGCELMGLGEDAVVPAESAAEVMETQRSPSTLELVMVMTVFGGVALAALGMAWLKFKTYEMAGKHGGWQGLAAVGGADALTSLGSMARHRENPRRRSRSRRRR
jgi:hypothetical protein